MTVKSIYQINTYCVALCDAFQPNLGYFWLSYGTDKHSVGQTWAQKSPARFDTGCVGTGLLSFHTHFDLISAILSIYNLDKCSTSQTWANVLWKALCRSEVAQKSRYTSHLAHKRWTWSYDSPCRHTRPNVSHALSVATFQTQHKFGAQSSTFLDDKTAPVAQENNFKMES